MRLVFRNKDFSNKTRVAIFASLCIANINLYATNPVQGWYAGLLLGVSSQASKSATFVTFPQYIPSQQGTLAYSILGDVGGQLGYRCNSFRVEGELFYNNNPMNTLTIGNKVINSSSTANGLNLDGASNMGAFMINGFYDFYTPTQDGSSAVVPYVGLGVGYSYIVNNITFTFNQNSLPNNNLSQTQTGFAGQGIIGLSYFMDDFTTFALDFRYFSNASSQSSVTIGANTFNPHTQIYSINLLFNGAFDFG